MDSMLASELFENVKKEIEQQWITSFENKKY